MTRPRRVDQNQAVTDAKRAVLTLPPGAMKHKYGATAVDEQGRSRATCEMIGVEYRKAFDSTREYRRWCELRLLEAAGQIRNLERQRRWPLMADAVHPDGYQMPPVKVGVYVADFTYEQDCGSYWQLIIEDCKGVRTAVYRLKARIFEANYGRKIRET